MRTGFALVAALSALCACGAPAASPEEVALEFWSAVASADSISAARFCRDASANEVALRLGADAPAEAPAIGSAATSENTALVETIFLSDGGAAPLRFHTHLSRAETGWQVELDETAGELNRARAAAP